MIVPVANGSWYGLHWWLAAQSADVWQTMPVETTGMLGSVWSTGRPAHCVVQKAVLPSDWETAQQTIPAAQSSGPSHSIV
jgi:hypothetical protein